MNRNSLLEELRGMGRQDLAEELEAATGDESLRLRTNLTLELRGPNGEVKQREEVHNLVCTAGKNKLLAVSGGEALTAFTYVAIGTSGTAASTADTALGAEIARSPIQTPTNPTAGQYQVQYTFPAGTGTGAIQEAGLFDAASAGNLFAHQVFAVINKGASDTLQITWTIS